MEVSADEAYPASDGPEMSSPEEPMRKRTRHNNDHPEEEATLPSLLHPQDVSNFLKLSTALRILLSGSITEDQLVEADRLIREYCTELLEVSTLLISPYQRNHFSY